VVAQFTASANGLEIGFDSDATGGSSDGNRQNGTLLQVRTTAASILAVGAAVLNTQYRFGVILRNDGAFHFVKGGIYTNWTLVWANLSNTYTMAYPHMSVTGSTAAAAVADYMRVPAVKWLPVPVISDGFSAWGTSDGLGHAEGLAGGLGSGGGGVAWAGATATIVAGKLRHVVGLGSELLTNVEFTTDVSSWAILAGATVTRRDFSSSPAIAPTGGVDDFGVEILTNGSGGAGIRQTPTIINHTWHEISCRAYWPSVNTAVNLAQLIGVQPSAVFNILAEDSWQTNRIITRSTSTAGDVRFRNISGTSGDIAYFDALSLKPITTATLFRTASTGVASVFASVAVTLTTGTQAGLVLNLDSAATPANFVIAYHDGTTCRLEKCVAGTYTSLISVTTTYVAGARLAVQRRGNAVRLYYNNVAIGTEQTVSDAGIVGNTLHGTFSTYELNEFDDLVIYDSGVGGAYDAVLDAI
jgi:hypothetical protein